MEVRQRPRPTGTQWFDNRELAAYLDAFGDDAPSLPETMRVLDIIAVDYIIETCYEAELHARYAGRQKVKVDDFQFALRNDTKKLGRIQEMLEKEKKLKSDRKVFEMPEGQVQKGAVGEDGEVKGKGKRGRKKKVQAEDDVGEDSPRKSKKRRKSEAGSGVGQSGGVGEDDIDLEEDDGD